MESAAPTERIPYEQLYAVFVELVESVGATRIADGNDVRKRRFFRAFGAASELLAPTRCPVCGETRAC